MAETEGHRERMKLALLLFYVFLFPLTFCSLPACSSVSYDHTYCAVRTHEVMMQAPSDLVLASDQTHLMRGVVMVWHRLFILRHVLLLQDLRSRS